MDDSSKKIDNWYLLLQSVEVLYENPNDEVESEKRPKDDKDDKKQIVEQRGFILRLFINIGNVNCVLHDLLPPIKSCLEEKNQFLQMSLIA